MASPKEWVQGARPRTLGAAIAPVLVGTAGATLGEYVHGSRFFAALGVSVFLQLGVNYANDYSDGVRGTDDRRQGPMRLTASGLARPIAVKLVATLCFVIAGAIGAWLSFEVDRRLLILGGVCIAMGALYTGGPKPLGYMGFGEVMVLACFGFAATAGSAYVQSEHVHTTVWIACFAVGLPAVAILLCNNVRDIRTDSIAGKRTLAVRIGDQNARRLYVLCIVGTVIAEIAIATKYPAVVVSLAGVGFVITPVKLMLRATEPPLLVRALVGTALFQLISCGFLAAALWTS